MYPFNVSFSPWKPTRLCCTRLVYNLVENAIKYTPNGGEVTLNLLTAPDTLTFAIKDSGIGIQPDDMKRLFEKFYRGTHREALAQRGTGLGLAISSRLVSLLGGELQLTSEVGRGSSFFFSLWFAYGDSEPAGPAHVGRDLLNEVDALIVDDNATNRRILAEMVRSWGLNPLMASSAADALQQLHQRANSGKPIPLLLTDVHMPAMDGLTLVQRIREHSQYSHLPVIVLTSGDRGAEVERCQRLAVSAHLMKPVKQSELLTAIENAQAAGAPERPSARETFAETTSRITPLRILLAEHGVTNQMLAVALLTKCAEWLQLWSGVFLLPAWACVHPGPEAL